MAKKPPSRSSASSEPQAEFLIMSIMSAVVPMIEANCGTMNQRDHNTLGRRIDLMVYVANWGTRRLMIGLPAEAVAEDVASWRAFEFEGGMGIRKSPKRVVLDLWSESEDGGDDFIEGEAWMASLAPVREEL